MGADRTLTPIDLRRAGPGWTVHFRCGGAAVVEEVVTHPPIRLTFVGFRCHEAAFGYAEDGTLRNVVHPNLLDIIRLDPPPMTEAQMRESLAEIAVIADFIDTQCYTGTVQEKIREILALAKGRS